MPQIYQKSKQAIGRMVRVIDAEFCNLGWCALVRSKASGEVFEVNTGQKFRCGVSEWCARQGFSLMEVYRQDENDSDGGCSSISLYV